MSENKESVERALRVVEGHGNVLVMRQMAKVDERKQRVSGTGPLRCQRMWQCPGDETNGKGG